ncbi:hypothetical protein [Arhodomonas sp. AD133]|uniref:hypothetical protein n=1 Tax=Arhodomonas sp. AD133 TaxID=3415009 RepID=UPI003EB705FA
MTKRRERLLFRVTRDGMLAPADGITQGRCRERGYHVGDELLAELTKPRHLGQWRCAHRLADLVRANIDGFDRLNAHETIKRLQLDARVACDEVEAVTTDGEVVRVYAPQSLSFANMDQAEWEEIYRALCRYVAETWWPELDEDQVAEMAEMMPGRAA